MCGIAGYAFADINTRPDLDKMLASLRRRGPDGTGRVTYPIGGLGHTRLAIIDPTASSAQPYIDQDTGVAIAFNGCIYNYIQLRDELIHKGHLFATSGDTEVVARAYLQWPRDFPRRLQGMFSIAVLDPRRPSLTLVRDRLGKKPLFTHHAGSQIIFSTSIPSLATAVTGDLSIDPISLQYYLSLHGIVPPPRTIFSQIKKVKPATLVEYHPEGIAYQTIYWHPPAAMPRPPERHYDALVQEFNNLFEKAVHSRLVGDSEVGLLISGGVDSAAVLAVAADKSEGSLKTYSIGFPDKKHIAGNEFHRSRQLANKFHTTHTELLCDDQMLVGALPTMLDGMVEPMSSHDCVAFQLLGEEVRKECKVVMCGQGADELLGGYRWHLKARTHTGPTASYCDIYEQDFRDRNHGDIHALLQPPWRLEHDFVHEMLRDHFSNYAGSAASAVLALDGTLMLAEDPVKRIDNMLMNSGVEARAPFLDDALVQFLLEVPADVRMGSSGKAVLKDAIKHRIGNELAFQQKQYFPVPSMTLLAPALKERCLDSLTSPSARERGLFHWDVVRAMAESNTPLTPLGANQLLQIAMLELWLQHHNL